MSRQQDERTGLGVIGGKLCAEHPAVAVPNYDRVLVSASGEESRGVFVVGDALGRRLVGTSAGSFARQGREDVMAPTVKRKACEPLLDQM